MNYEISESSTCYNKAHVHKTVASSNAEHLFTFFFGGDSLISSIVRWGSGLFPALNDLT